MVSLITISNNGQNILKTNYWDTDNAKAGYLYLSWNAGAARLLVPESQLSEISEMRTGKYVIISRGKYQDGRAGIELVFEDNSSSPYSIHMVLEQCDRLVSDADQGGGFVLSIWTKSGKQFELPAKYRVVKNLPDLSPWSEN